MFNVGVCSSVGEIGFAASACEVSAFRVFALSSCVFLNLHTISIIQRFLRKFSGLSVELMLI